MARDRALANARAIAEGRDPRQRMRQVPTFEKANETDVLAVLLPISSTNHMTAGRVR